MAEKYRTSYKVYPAWDYQEEIEDLNAASEKGWQLIKGGCFHSRFVYRPDICYRYQLDYQKVEDMGRYLEIFREQGWEYVNSTFNGWHFFRKIYDPSLPEEEYEIFTDRESLTEIQKRWVRIGAILGAICGVFAVISLVRMVLQPHLPVLFQLLLFAVECAVMLCGAVLMRRPESVRNHRRSRLLFNAFLCIILVGCVGNVLLTEMRPYAFAEQGTEEVSEPVQNERYLSFDVKYADRYYLDLELQAESPVTFEVVNAEGASVYTNTGTDVQEEDVPIRLSAGEYWFSVYAETGYHLRASID